MGKHFRVSAILLLFATSLFTAPALAQNKDKGGDKAHKQADHKPAKQHADKSRKQAYDQADKADKRGNADHVVKVKDRDDIRIKDKDDRDAIKKFDHNGKAKSKFERDISVHDLKPKFKNFALSKRMPERIAVGAIARGLARGMGDDDIIITPSSQRVRLLNRSGVLLVDLDEARARNLGGWRVWPDERAVRGDGPAFCRSGKGHPVWGRQWCIDKGFGLGSFNGMRWGVARGINDIDFRRVDAGTLTRAVLIDVLGDVVFDRLGLHAITLGATDPLTGVWLGEPSGSRVLYVTAGDTPIAEIVDTNRDNRAEFLLVSLRPW